MPSSSSNRSNPVPAPDSVPSQSFNLRLLVFPGERVLADLSQAIEKYASDPGHLIGVIGANMRVELDLSGVTPHSAERLARRLIRQPFVLSLSGRCFDARGRETFGIDLYSPHRAQA